jgi:DNA-binding NarL/FixJ family response regulator
MRGISSSPETPAKQRILIVDAHTLVRRGLRALIDNEPDLIVCGEAATHRQALEVIAASTPDLVIADLSIGDGAGITMVEDIRALNADLPLLALSMHDAPRYAERAFRAGAGGYALKQEMSETLLIAIRLVLNGRKYASPRIQTGLDTAQP